MESGMITSGKAAVTANQRLEQVIKNMTDIIDSLRLSITYMTFDLEATKRENQQLRQMLKERA